MCLVLLPGVNVPVWRTIGVVQENTVSLFSVLGWKHAFFPPLNIMLDVVSCFFLSILWMPFIGVRKIPSIPSLLRVFIRGGCWGFMNAFPPCTNGSNHVSFLLYLLMCKTIMTDNFLRCRTSFAFRGQTASGCNVFLCFTYCWTRFANIWMRVPVCIHKGYGSVIFLCSLFLIWVSR